MLTRFSLYFLCFFLFSFSLERCALTRGPEAFWKSIRKAILASGRLLQGRCPKLKTKEHFIELFDLKNQELFRGKVVLAIDEFDGLFGELSLLQEMLLALRALKQTPRELKSLQVLLRSSLSLFFSFSLSLSFLPFLNYSVDKRLSWR